MVLDEDEHGYNIYKLDLHDDHADQDGGGAPLVENTPFVQSRIRLQSRMPFGPV